MDLTHSFTVPASLEDTWTAFQDIEDIGACFPGATVTSVEGDEFKGTVKVKLGPIALQYAGTGRFVERDEAARTFVVEAKGKDKRGNGTASALVTATMTSEAADSTSVEVQTDLSITGKPAQFGRGVIQDVSDKLLQQFIDCLEGRVGAAPPAEEEGTLEEAVPAPAAAAEEGPAPEERAAAAEEEPAGLGGGAAADQGAATAAAAAGATPAGTTATGPAEARPAAGVAGSGAAAPRPAGPGKRKAEQADAIDLGATVLPILLKTYWKQIAGAVLVVLVLRKLLRRKR